MKWNGKRVLVTGAGGFIGSHLTERLVEVGATVRALVHYNALGTWGWLDRSVLALLGALISLFVHLIILFFVVRWGGYGGL